MTSRFHPATPPSAQRGQVAAEYAIASVALTLILGVGMVDDNSVLWELIRGFQTAYQRFSYALSLPT